MSVRVVQFLESYKSVTIDSMAASFGVTPQFIDTELVDFIVAGRLTAKIDKVAGVIETNRWACFFSRHAAGVLWQCACPGRWLYGWVLRKAMTLHSRGSTAAKLGEQVWSKQPCQWHGVHKSLQVVD